MIFFTRIRENEECKPAFREKQLRAQSNNSELIESDSKMFLRSNLVYL